MTPAEFNEALLQSAKRLDAPRDGAKARALAQLGASGAAAAAAAATAGAGATTAATATAGIKMSVLAWSVAASFAVAGAGGYAIARATEHTPPIVSEPAKAHVAGMPASASTQAANEPVISHGATPVFSAGDGAPAASANACTMHPLREAAPATCSRAGKDVHVDVRNGCTEDVDVFWVDFKCEEVFHKRLGPGEKFLRGTQTGHVWRIRDHATHALLKEFVPERVPGVPDDYDAPLRTLPDVTVHAGDAAAVEEKPPPACSGPGVKSKFTLRNDGDRQVVLMWVGLDCEEKYWERVEGKQTRVVNGRDADAWRVRDAKTGALVLDIVPDVPDTTTYVTVP